MTVNGRGEAAAYDEFYYQHGCGLPYERNEHWLHFFGQIAERIVRGIGPRVVLDAGCAMGFLVEALRERGVEAYGVDISDYAIAQVAEAVKPYCRQGSVLEPLPRRYDLIVCIEVLEHLPPPDSERALANLCQATDDLIFSSTPSDYREATHLNVQPPEYWARLFAEQGFVRDVDFDLGVIAPWAMRVRRTHEALPQVIAAYERKYWRLWQENHQLREARRELEEMERRVAQAESDVQVMQASRMWRLGERLSAWRSRLAPAGSRRERLLRRSQGRVSGQPKGLRPE